MTEPYDVSDDGTAMSDALTVAVVGVGHFGRFHAEKYAASDDARLAAVADIDGARAAAVGQALGVEALSDYRNLLDRVDAVSVAVPTVSHFEVARAFLEAGVDVLVEKPICAEVLSGEKLVQIAQVHGRILQVGHLERFSGVVEALRRQAFEPLYIDSIRIAPFKARGTDVNVILDLMIHDLDLVLSLVEAPILAVDAVGAPVFTDSEDIASVRLKFANGCVANIVASRISLKTERRMRVFANDLYATVDFDRRTIVTARRAAGRSPPVALTEETYSEGDPLEREIAAFLAAVRERRRPTVSGEDGLEALKAAILVNESLRAHADFVESTGALAVRSRSRG